MSTYCPYCLHRMDVVSKGSSVGVGSSTGAVVGSPAGIGLSVCAGSSAWPTPYEDGLFSGPEQAKKVVREMKIAKYSSFSIAVVLFLRLGSFPSVG